MGRSPNFEHVSIDNEEYDVGIDVVVPPSFDSPRRCLEGQYLHSLLQDERPYLQMDPLYRTVLLRFFISDEAETGDEGGFAAFGEAEDDHVEYWQTEVCLFGREGVGTADAHRL